MANFYEHLILELKKKSVKGFEFLERGLARGRIPLLLKLHYEAASPLYCRRRY